MFPIIKSLSESFGSTPKDGTERKMGAFLIFTEFQGNLITAAMFLTAMAGNPIAQSLAEKDRSCSYYLDELVCCSYRSWSYFTNSCPIHYL